MNRLRQPSFYHFGALFVALALAAGAANDPSADLAFASRAADAAALVLVYALSIVLAAGPFVFAGAVAAQLVRRFANDNAFVAALLAALAPGCECGLNGFAPALRRCAPPLAGAALTWGAVCNPVALAATAAMLGGHVLMARAAGGLVAACTVALTWSVASKSPLPAHRHETCSPQDGLAARVESAMRTLAPAAAAAAIALVALPAALRAHASPWSAALAGALLSPCSSSDAVLASVFASAPAAKAAFVVAGQCLDVRQTALFAREFGMRRALLAWLCGAAASAVAAALA